MAPFSSSGGGGGGNTGFVGLRRILFAADDGVGRGLGFFPLRARVALRAAGDAAFAFAAFGMVFREVAFAFVFAAFEDAFCGAAFAAAFAFAPTLFGEPFAAAFLPVEGDAAFRWMLRWTDGALVVPISLAAEICAEATPKPRRKTPNLRTVRAQRLRHGARREERS